MIAASMPSSAPLRASTSLPVCPSSAGVPSRTTRPAGASAEASASRAARNAPTPDAAMTLCPHAWPIPGSASYSAQIAIVGPPVPASARKAVGTPCAPSFAVTPCRASTSTSVAALRCSSNAGSGSACRRRTISTRSGSSRSAACSTAVTSAAGAPPSDQRSGAPVRASRRPAVSATRWSRYAVLGGTGRCMPSIVWKASRPGKIHPLDYGRTTSRPTKTRGDRMSTAASPVRPSRADRFLGAVERLGNRLPEPFTLFLILFLVVALVSTAMALADVTVQIPGADEVTEIKGLFTPEGLTWFTSNIGANYSGFPPLVTVLTIWLAVGVAEKTGLLAAGVRAVFGSAPRRALPYAVGFVGVLGSVMADSAFIVIPPLAAMVFRAAGRHPVAGLLGGFAAAGAGYSTNISVTSLDALFAGITTAVTEILPNPGDPVNPLSNWFFNVVSAVLLSALAGLLIDKVLEPRLVRQAVPVDEAASAAQDDGGLDAVLSDAERRGLRLAVGATLLVAAVLAVAFVLPGSPWRNEDGGYLPESPLLSSITFVIFVLFLVPGVVYGVVTGTVSSMKDVPRLLE